jgi:hypothetical protein
MHLLFALCLLGSTAAAAELRFEQPIAHLGERRGGPVCEQRFDFVNAGSMPIEIVGVRRDCGCLDVILDSKTLAPGARGSLRLRVRTLGQPEGQRTWNAWVQYRSGNTIHEERLSVAATIRNELVVEPAALALHVETAVREEITITDRRASGMRVTAAQASLPGLKATLVPQGQGVTRVLLEVAAADLPLGRHEATLRLHTDDPYYRQLEVPITLTRGNAAAVTAAPNIVHVTAERSAHLVRLRPSGSARVVVAEARSSDPAVRCTWASGPDTAVTLKLQVDGQALAANCLVTVRCAEPAGATLTLPVLLRRDP